MMSVRICCFATSMLPPSLCLNVLSCSGALSSFIDERFGSFRWNIVRSHVARFHPSDSPANAVLGLAAGHLPKALLGLSMPPGTLVCRLPTRLALVATLTSSRFSFHARQWPVADEGHGQEL